MIQRAENDSQRGQGAVAADLMTKARRRSTARMLRKALDQLPEVSADPEFWTPIVAALKVGATDTDDPRGSAQCASVLSALRLQQIRIIESLDKTTRLDSGQPTERVEAGGSIRLNVHDPRHRDHLARILQANQPVPSTNGNGNGHAH